MASTGTARAAQPEAEDAGTEVAAGGAAEQEPGTSPERLSLFGWRLPHDERLRITGTMVAGWSHDGAQAQLGFEKQGRVGQATITFSGRVNDRLRYLVAINPINDVSSKPACGEADFFYPNNPAFYTSGPVVPCEPEAGQKRVDTYNTYALDFVNQQGPLREGYIDWRATDAMTARLGRFILPLGFAPADVGSWTAKDLTRIQRLNAEASFGAMVGYTRHRADGAPLFEVAVAGVLGEGNREKDYDWFYFADTSLDSNSALTMLGTVRARPHAQVDVRVGYKRGFTGSKVERLPSYWASKRNDDALVAGVKARVHPWVSVFGEYARYVWGPTATSAEMLGFDPDPIVKPGYYAGATLEVPVTGTLRLGATVTREEMSRDDSLVKYLAHHDLYGVRMGRTERGLIARVYAEVAEVVTVGVFWADISNPFPWISGSWPVAGPRAFSGREPDRYGLAVVLRTP